MQPVTRRNHRSRHSERALRRQRALRRMFHPSFPESLEDRTLLDGQGPLDYSVIQNRLASIFHEIQKAVNDHLLSPNPQPTKYSLPLVGAQLGQPDDKVGQVFQGLSDRIDNATIGKQDVVGDLNQALKSYAPYIDAHIDEPTMTESGVEFVLHAKTIADKSEHLDLELGLPGMSPFDVSLPGQVSSTLNFTLTLYFGLDPTGFYVDTTQHLGPSPPLLHLEVDAKLEGLQLDPNNPAFHGVQTTLNDISVLATDNGDGKGASSLHVPVDFYAVGTPKVRDLSNFSLTHITLIDFNNDASAHLDLRFQVTDPDSLTLYVDAGINWPLTSKMEHAGPFDSAANAQPVQLEFHVGADLASLATILDPNQSPIFQALQQDLVEQKSPLLDFLHFVSQPIPVLSDLGISITPKNVLSSLGVDLSALDELTLFLEPGNSISLSSTGAFTFADARVTDDLTNPVQNLPQAIIDAKPTADADGLKAITKVLDGLDGPLLGTVEIPIMDDPSLAFNALLNPDHPNISLFQYTPNITAFNETKPLGSFPLVPPFPIFIEPVVTFQGTIGLTIGYSTYGLTRHSESYDPRFGLFVMNPELTLTGGVGLRGVLNAGVLEAGATGSVSLTLGINGINPNATFKHSLRITDFSKTQITVLQLDDIRKDFAAGGALCPFDVGGSVDLSLNVFVKIGFDPFSIEYDVPLANLTLLTFGVSCCAPSDTILAEDVTNVSGFLKRPIIQAKLPETKHFLLLNLGDYGPPEGISLDPTSSESFVISEELDRNGNPNGGLVVSAYGLVNAFDYQGYNFDWDSPDTTIVALGHSGTHAQRIKVAPGVMANAYLIGGGVQNQFVYLGNGDTYMEGGVWNPAASELAKLPQPMQTLNTLQGGLGSNWLKGGDLVGGPPGLQLMPQWNMLIANPAAILGEGQDGRERNGGIKDILEAGTAGATMKGGGLGGDAFLGSSKIVATSSQYVMIAGKNVGDNGPDYMFGGYGTYDFQWQEGAGPLRVFGNPQALENSKNRLDVAGSQSSETWTIDPAPDLGEFHVNGVRISGVHQTDIVADPVADIEAWDVRTVSVDAADQYNTGNETYIVNDLSNTGVYYMNVNLHEHATQPDSIADHVTVNAPAGGDDVSIIVPTTLSSAYPDPPTYSDQYTSVLISPLLVAPPGTFVLPPYPFYYVNAAVPNMVDTLNVNTSDAADHVWIAATQPGQTTIRTFAGDDTIEVGGNYGGLNVYASLNNIEGPLVVDAGPDHNQITLDEQFSTAADVVTLSTGEKPVSDQGLQASRLLLLEQAERSLKEPLIDPFAVGYLFRYKGGYAETGVSPDGARSPEYRYPAQVMFLASAKSDFSSGTGDFSRGVTFLGTESSAFTDNKHFDQIYVDSVLPFAPTTLSLTYADIAHVYAGFDGGPSSTTDDPVTSDPASTLDYFFSTLVVTGKSGLGSTSLTVDDEGTPRGDIYVVTETAVLRQYTSVEIVYQSLASLMVVTAATQDNFIDVSGTAAATNTRVVTGNGNSAISVADPSRRLDEILGPLTIHGGDGLNILMIDDSGNGHPQSYFLSSGALTRVAAASIQIYFDHIASLRFQASDNTGTNNIFVDGTLEGVTVAIDPGGGDATLDVNTLDNIQGPVDFQWGTGTKTFYAHDYAAALGAVYQVLPDQLLRNQAAPITFHYGSDPLAGVVLETGQLHNATVLVPETKSATPLLLFLGQATNEVIVSDIQRNLDTIRGNLSIFGNGNTTAYMLDDNAGPGRSYTIDAGYVSFNSFLPAIQYTALSGLTVVQGRNAHTYVGSIAKNTSVDLALGKGINSVDVWPPALAIQGPLTVSGQGGNDTLTIHDQGAPPIWPFYDLSATSVSRLGMTVSYFGIDSVILYGRPGPVYYRVNSVNPNPNTHVFIAALGFYNVLWGPDMTNTWSITGPNSGVLDNRIIFKNVQNLVGGNGVDSFIFAAKNSFVGKIDGGGGRDWVDYSAYTTKVSVNLNNHEATGVKGGITNIENVRGGSGNDTLTGAAKRSILIGGGGADTIQGGSGRSILIGGPGDDVVNGGNADDILVGGFTDYDSRSVANDRALESILAEWQSGDSYLPRVNLIRSGGGKYGTKPLAWRLTVHDDANTNMLTGGLGMDWFFSGIHDKIVDKKPGEQLN